MAVATRATGAAVERLDVSAFTVPTELPESDGTAEWDSTTLVLVEAHAGGHQGLGYTYADAAAAALIERTLAPSSRGATRLRSRRRMRPWRADAGTSAGVGSAQWQSQRSTRHSGT